MIRRRGEKSGIFDRVLSGALVASPRLLVDTLAAAVETPAADRHAGIAFQMFLSTRDTRQQAWETVAGARLHAVARWLHGELHLIHQHWWIG